MNDLKNFPTGTLIADILRFAPHTEIAHHIPGRIRLKLLESGIEIVQDVDFDAIVSCIPGLVNIQIKGLSKSVVINYDPQKLSGDLWEELNRIKKNPTLASKMALRLQALFEKGNGG